MAQRAKNPYTEFGGGAPDLVVTGNAPDPHANDYGQFDGYALRGPGQPGTGLNRFGELDEGTGLIPPAPLVGPVGRDAVPKRLRGSLTAWDKINVPAMALTGGDLATGAGKGVLATGEALGRGLNRVPLIGNFVAPRAPLDLLHRYDVPIGTAQHLGFGAEKAAEFLLPGLAEEGVVAHLGELVPAAQKAAPLVRIGYQGLTSGLLNKLQGGSFGAGAALGAGGGAVSEGMRAIAPSIAESALGIRKIDRAYGKRPGVAALQETRGLRPATVAASAEERLHQLDSELGAIVDRASVRPRAIRGLLEAPERDVILSGPRVRQPKRGGLYPAEIRQDFAEGPDLYPEAGSLPGAPQERGTRIDGNELYYHGIPNPQYLPGGPHPELSGHYTPPNGVLRTRDWRAGEPAAVDEFGRVMQPPLAPRGDIPAFAPNRIVSFDAPRTVLRDAADTALRRNARKVAAQIEPMMEHLNTLFATGGAIPARVTPREALDLKRGFGEEFIHNWNPETMRGVKHTAAKAYRSLAEALHTALPETEPLDMRISSLIPVANRAESVGRAADGAQRAMGRLSAHTGALAGAVGGGITGYREHGLGGAATLGLLGLALPEVVASPTGQMAAARILNSQLPAALFRFGGGSALQLKKPNR